jgi:prepilin-type N-terminal cleavage/methylation domain-containing protein
MKYTKGFTVVELITVVAVISILAGIVIFNAVAGSARSRDVDRQADLKTLQSAVELYKQRYGRYPAQCTRANPVTAGAWSGQPGTNFACVTGEQYIMGHIDTADYDRDGNTTERFTFAPEFIPSLPIDKRTPDANSGYVYAVNANGTVYKIAARRTVETERVTYSHPLKSCDANNSSQDTSQSQFYNTAPLCNYVFSAGGESGRKPSWCEENNATFQTSYAVWGGNAFGSGDMVGSSADNTEDIACL